MCNKVSLKDLFLDLQAEIEASLGVSRRNIAHPSSKGEAGELCWVETLRCYLPLRYQVERAFVVDHEGTISDQIDVVIFDRQYCPFLMNHNGARFIPAESVYAVFEVKQDLSRQHIQYAGDKAASVRRLKRTSVDIVHAGGTSGAREPLRILAGILTLDSGWTEPLGKPLDEALECLSDEQCLDLGCCVKHGSFECTSEQTGTDVCKVERERSLVFFIMRLLHRLQAVGTVPAINLDAYLKHTET